MGLTSRLRVFSISNSWGSTKLCGLPNVALTNPHRVMTALRWYSNGLDFADALHLAASKAAGYFIPLTKNWFVKPKAAASVGDEPQSLFLIIGV